MHGVIFYTVKHDISEATVLKLGSDTNFSHSHDYIHNFSFI